MITDRLYELDRLALDNPDLELRLAELANRDSKEYFFSEVNVLNKDFIKLKLYIHYHINVMDEIVNVFEDNKNIRHSLEYGSWKLYILLTMKHPLFQEVYNSCSDIWGDRLNKFLNREGVAVEDQIKLNALYNNPRNV
ncbi:MAG: hypothetical protein H6579_01940 [Chitinophagales bacterium]|nr:hypothetical protein [Bacteroidota bacterium]MCB9255872.1 hypothetical protein [Chitinophagales bacterium]